MQRYQELQDIIAILGMDELSDRRQADRHPRPQAAEVPVPAVLRWPRTSPACRANMCPLAETVKGFAAIVDGQCDDLPEWAFFNVGTLDDARKKADNGEEKGGGH